MRLSAIQPFGEAKPKKPQINKCIEHTQAVRLQYRKRVVVLRFVLDLTTPCFLRSRDDALLRSNDLPAQFGPTIRCNVGLFSCSGSNALENVENIRPEVLENFCSNGED